MIKRTVIIDLTFSCCKDEKYRNIDHTIRITLHQNAEKFTTSLKEWVDIFLAKDKVKDYIYSLGDNKCGVVDPSLRMCRKPPNEPVIDVIDYYQEPPEAPPEIPQDVLDRIERLEDLITDSMKAIGEYESMIADILTKKEEEKTADDREKLLRLDEYIRSEKENIRKFEGEIRRLKKDWDIE